MAIQIATAGGQDSQSQIFVTVQNDDATQAGGLYPGQCVEWVSTTTDAAQGYYVRLVTAASANTTAGLSGAVVAGVVDTTIMTAAVGRIQVWGPANVRASASINGPTMVVTYSINATNIGHVDVDTATTLVSPRYAASVVGYTMEDGPNATNSRVFLKCM